MTEDECREVMDRVVQAYAERNPDLWLKAFNECYLYGGVTAETSAEIMEKMDAEARS